VIEVRPLGDLLDTLIDYRGRTPQKTDSGVPLITAKVIKGGRIASDKLEFIAEEAYDAWMRRGLPRPGDILITTEAPLGEVAQIGDDAKVALAQRVILLRPDRREVDPQFLFHYLRSPEAQGRLRRRASGTTVSGIRQPELRAVEISLLARTDQEKVSLILDSLDDLVENNRRRIDLLEQMAQAIYREWFVNFRYPGYENAIFIDSPVGLVPDDWEIKRLGDIIEVDKGLSYKGSYLTETGVPMANLKCFRPGGGFRRDGTKPYSGPFKPKHEVFPGDLIVANTDLTQAGAVIGSPALVPRRGFESGGIISHHLFAIRSVERELLPWLFELFHDDRFRSYARGVASGTTVLGFRPADLLSYQLACPPEPLWKAFGNVAENLFRNAEDLSEASDHLVDIRGLLLPRLVTGRIDVSSLDLDSVVEFVA
jgi:type I restriction enzyme S subunit